jgi:hypothetical protein
MSPQGVMSSNRPITTLVCVLLKDSSRAPIAGSGLEINSRDCLCVLQRPRRNARCFFSIYRFIFLRIFCLQTPKTGSGPTNRWAELSLASLSAILFPLTPAWPGTQNSPTACRVEIIRRYYMCRLHINWILLQIWKEKRVMMTQCNHGPDNILIKQKLLQEPQSSHFVRRNLTESRTAGEATTSCTAHYSVILISHKVLVFTFM